MEQNYIQKRILNNVMKDRNIGRTLGLEKNKKIVLDTMIEKKVSTDLSKLPGYKRKEFVQAVTGKIGIGYETKKAFQSVYGDKKPQSPPHNINAAEENVARKSSYDEIMNKRKNISQGGEIKYEKSKTLNFSASDKGLRRADALLIKPKEKPHHFYDPARAREIEEDDDLKERLKKIQS